jgi:hypothetical protein
MENKEIYMQYLASAKAYVPYNYPTHIAVASPSGPAAAAPVAQTPPCFNEGNTVYAKHLQPHRSLFAPTVILDLDLLYRGKKRTRAQIIELIEAAIECLQIEFKRDGWRVVMRDAKYSYVLKGCNSTRGSAFGKILTAEECADKCEEWNTNGSMNATTMEKVRFQCINNVNAYTLRSVAAHTAPSCSYVYAALPPSPAASVLPATLRPPTAGVGIAEAMRDSHLLR